MSTYFSIIIHPFVQRLYCIFSLLFADTMASSYKQLVTNKGFMSFIATQFLGAFNDNFYKVVVQLLALTLLTSQAEKNTALTLASIIFVLPSLLFSGYAGHFADTFSKRHVLISTKLIEIIAMGLAFFALTALNINFILVVLFLMATQSTFFSPAKYGIIPEMLPVAGLSHANGLLQLTTFTAIILGTTLGTVAIHFFSSQQQTISFIQLMIATTGFLTSLWIHKVPASGRQQKLSINPYREIYLGFKRLGNEKVMLMAVLAISYFFGIGIVTQQTLLVFSKNVLHVSDLGTGALLATTALGIGLGSFIAGWLSGDNIELGLIPLGALGLGIIALLIGTLDTTIYTFFTLFAALGFFGGLYIVPLNALVQDMAKKQEKGRILATNNFLNYIAMLTMIGLLWCCTNIFHVSAQHVFIIIALMTFGVTFIALYHLPMFFIQLILWLLTHTLFKIQVKGHPHIPSKGPALIIANHVSYVDGLIIGATLRRFIHFMIHAPIYHHKSLNWFFKLANAIPVEGGSPKKVAHSLAMARRQLKKGHVVCIFAEGRLTRTGNMLPFRRGYQRILEKIDVPIIPVHLDQLFESMFAKKHGKGIFHCLQLRNSVTISFGEPLPSTTEPWEVRRVIQELSAQAPIDVDTKDDLLALKFLQTARFNPKTLCVRDSSGVSLSYLNFTARALILAKRFKRQFKRDKYIGILLTPSMPAALINTALVLAGKIVVNFPYEDVPSDPKKIVHQTKMQHIITSKSLIKKLTITKMDEMIFIENMPLDITKKQKWRAIISLYVTPLRHLCKRYGHLLEPDAPQFVQFSRGTSGESHGIILSNRNILANIVGLSQILHLGANDRIAGVLPFYGAFGLTYTLWLPLVTGMGMLFYDKKEDIENFGWFVAKNKATVLIDLPSGYLAYLEKIRADNFSHLRYALVGGASMPKDFLYKFRDKFGLDLLESYGCTEMAPSISVNIPNVRSQGQLQRGKKLGSVGHPIPGVAVKIINPHNGETLGLDQEGLLLVKGMGQMLGYLGHRERTQAVIKDGWFNTQDLASMDEDGFLYFAGRIEGGTC